MTERDIDNTSPRVFFGKGVPRQHWARFAFLSEHGDDIHERVRRDRARLGLPPRVEVVL